MSAPCRASMPRRCHGAGRRCHAVGSASQRARQPPGTGSRHGLGVTKTVSPRKSATTSGEWFLAHPAHALWAAGGMLALVVLIAILVPAGPLALDRSWSEAMHHLETPLLTDLALVFNWLGRGIGRAITLTLVGLLLLRRRRWLALVAFAVAESLAPLLSTLLKVTGRSLSPARRARPPRRRLLPVRPRHLRRRDLCRARPALHHTRRAPQMVVGARQPRHRRHGLESHVPASPLAHGRHRRRTPRQRHLAPRVRHRTGSRITGRGRPHPPRIARPVSGSKKCRARWSTTTSTASPSRTRVRGLKPPDEARLVRLQPCCELSDRTIVADVLGKLADVVADRLRRCDREVIEHPPPRPDAVIIGWAVPER